MRLFPLGSTIGHTGRQEVGNYICEIFQGQAKGHCTNPAYLVAFDRRNPSVRVILCQRHRALMDTWARTDVDAYAAQYGLTQDAPIVSGRKGPRTKAPRRTSQAIAMSLRGLLYASQEGAVYNDYPNGPGRPVRVPYTSEERAENARACARVLAEWRETDPDGHRGWELATQAMRGGDRSFLAFGWSAMVHEEYGLNIVDPCAFCHPCRNR